MTKEQETLLLTVARLLREHLTDHIALSDFLISHQDMTALDDALAPFERAGDFATIHREIKTA